MSQVLPAEGGLRRVIGDGESLPDGEVEGSARRAARALPQPRAPADVRRALGRLSPAGPDRDVRDLLEPRGDAGRLGVRARGSRLDLPGVPRVRDRAPARDAGLDRPLVVAGPSGRVVEPDGVQRRLDLRPDRDADPPCGRVRLGLRAQGRGSRRPRLLRRRRDLGGLVPRGCDFRRGHEGAGRPLLQQQPVGDLDSALGADRRRRRSPTRRSATGSRESASTAATSSPSTRRRARRSRGRARAKARPSSRR